MGIVQQGVEPVTGKPARIGVFGGTFNPIHHGHLLLAESARQALNLDIVLFVPALIPPHKQTASVAPENHRAQMVHLAIRSNPCFDICLYEIEHRRVSYTVDTLRYLHETYPQAQLTLLIGSDNLDDFPRWHQPDRILELAQLAVWTRPGHTLQSETPFCHVPAPLMEISSSQIRSHVALGKSIRYMTPDPVIEYIQQHELYRQTS